MRMGEVRDRGSWVVGVVTVAMNSKIHQNSPLKLFSFINSAVCHKGTKQMAVLYVGQYVGAVAVY